MNDRQVSVFPISNSISDAMACGLSVILAMNVMIGRIGPLEILLLTFWTVILFELNDQLFWRMFITDSGYGMRVWILGPALGLTASIVLGKTDTT